MPAPDQSEYNPNIIGFTQHQGPVFISLTEAKERYGELPSNYKLVSVKDSRQVKKVLNLSIGKMLTEKLKSERANLKRSIFLFFQSWHRDWKTEFGILMKPFFNLNNPDRLYHILAEIKNLLLADSDRPARTFLAEAGLFRKDVLNSIPDEMLLASAERILKKKQRNLSSRRRYKAPQHPEHSCADTDPASPFPDPGYHRLRPAGAGPADSRYLCR